MHEQTKREREEKEKSKQDRKSALANRLKKVRDRKRLKMGLPMLESDDEDVPSVEENPEEKSQEELNDAVMKALRDIREKVSISSTFYFRLFPTRVFCEAFL